MFLKLFEFVVDIICYLKKNINWLYIKKSNTKVIIKAKKF